MPVRRDVFPSQALTWLLGTARHVLVLGPTGALLDGLGQHGHTVTACDPDHAVLRRLREHRPDPAPPGGAPTFLVARGDALPVRPHRCGAVLVSQQLHELDPERAFREFARVLTVGGTLGIVYTTRDDTVPWVRRLARLLQAVDPTAMQGGYGSEAAAQLENTHYFTAGERETFRTWVPISRAGLTAMVARRPAVAALAADDRERLLAEVAGFYDSLARGPEPLLLPYQLQCHRARVNHADMSVPIRTDTGLRLL